MSAPESATAPQLLSKPEAATYLGISVDTLNRCVKRGEIPFIKISKFVKFNLEDLQSIRNNSKTLK